MVCGEFGEDWIETPLIGLFLCSKNGILARKTHEDTGLKLGMHTQLDSRSNMGLVPLGHPSSSWREGYNVINGILIEPYIFGINFDRGTFLRMSIR